MAPKQSPIVLPPNLCLERLISVQQLLHLTVHRNSNQHRIAKWWANLQLLRRSLKRLVELLSSKEAEYRKGKEAILKLCQWMETQLVPRVYLSFSAVVADNQYASLGLMLMGCLARVNACVAFPRSRVQSEDEGVGEVDVRRSVVVTEEDFGEAITRGEERLKSEVLREAVEGRKRAKGKSRRAVLDGEDGETVSRSSIEPASKNSLKREVLDVDGSSDSDGEQKIPAKKVKKVSKKFVSEYDHLSGNSSSEEELAPKTSKKVVTQLPEESGGEEQAKPPPKKVKKSTPGAKSSTAKAIKKKKKKGGDDFDDLFAGLM